jgi:hypothetical protein
MTDDLDAIARDLRAARLVTLAERVERAAERERGLVAALEALLDSYVQLVNSGDCGFWNPEGEAEVKAARAALANVGLTCRATSVPHG